MNKAFVREPDEPDDLRCPRCNTIGESVGPDTLAAHLPAELAGKLASASAYCPNPACDAGYFDAMNQIIAADQILKPMYPKNPAAPICACFGVSAERVIDAARAKNPLVVREMLAKAQSPEAHCASAAASGKSCAGEVQRLYLRELRQGK